MKRKILSNVVPFDRRAPVPSVAPNTHERPAPRTRPPVDRRRDLIEKVRYLQTTHPAACEVLERFADAVVRQFDDRFGKGQPS